MRINKKAKIFKAKKNLRKGFPINKLFPNMITIAAICSGLSAIKFALDSKWENAVIFVILAAFFDIMDGRVARLLKATSEFGAQLDSLSDFLCYGITPSLILYLWKLKEIPLKGLGWGIALFYTVCCAIRLARFNASLSDNKRPIWAENYFVGMPSTAAGILSMIPLALSFQFKDIFSAQNLAIYMIFLSLMMPSRVPTFSTKKIIIKPNQAYLILLFTGLFFAFILIEPWYCLALFGVLYLISIPFSIFTYKKYSSYQQSLKTQNKDTSVNIN